MILKTEGGRKSFLAKVLADKKTFKSYFGFTLAEVLITLGIIGVVAAITIPTLVQKYQKKVLVNQLKSTYSILTNGYKQMIVMEGADDLAQVGDSTKGRNEEIKMYKKYFKVVAEVPYALNHEEKYKYKNIKGTEFTTPSYGLLVLANGAYIHTGSVLLTYTQYPQFDYETPMIVKARIMVDVNGKKGPNIEGRDIFYFNLNPDGSLEPLYGSASSGFDPNTRTYDDPDNTGAKRIIEDGWEMNY